MSTLEQLQYGFDRDSRRTWQKRPLSTSQDQSYQYDALSQVSHAARGSINLNMTAISGVPESAQSWDYDPTGNWRGYYTAANGAVTLDQHRVHDRGNRLTQIEDSPNNMILDRVGRMRQAAPDVSGDWDGKLEITWDAWSRITSVKDNDEVVGEYTYDGLTRRVTREVGEETLHSYFNNQWRPLEERKDSETTAALSYLWGERHRDDLVRRDRAVGGTSLNETRYILMDYFNPASITDEDGVVTERYAFSAFGVRSILYPDFTVRSSSECGMEFGFQGQFLDKESALMNYGYRYYAPYLGRWTCKDPVIEEGGFNLYKMVGNQAVNHVDFMGLFLSSLFDDYKREVDYPPHEDIKGGTATTNVVITPKGENQVDAKHCKANVKKSLEFHVTSYTKMPTRKDASHTHGWSRSQYNAVAAHEKRRARVHEEAYKAYLEPIPKWAKRCNPLKCSSDSVAKQSLSAWLERLQQEAVQKFWDYVNSQQDLIDVERAVHNPGAISIEKPSQYSPPICPSCE
jgi:RHS repeat-associated protein